MFWAGEAAAASAVVAANARIDLRIVKWKPSTSEMKRA
jgi:hypothetical protein